MEAALEAAQKAIPAAATDALHDTHASWGSGRLLRPSLIKEGTPVAESEASFTQRAALGQCTMEATYKLKDTELAHTSGHSSDRCLAAL